MLSKLVRVIGILESSLSQCILPRTFQEGSLLQLLINEDVIWGQQGDSVKSRVLHRSILHRRYRSHLILIFGSLCSHFTLN